MSGDGVFVLLLVVATAVAIASRRLQIPYTAALVIAGLTLGALHAFEVPHLTKELLFSVFVPGLLFEAAFHVDAGEFWRNRLTVIGLAVPGVVAAIAATSLLLVQVADHLEFVKDFDWHTALIFGALIAATDPIAVVGLFKTLGAPPRLSLLVEGESLLNDGTAIVLFTLVLAMVSGAHASPGALALDFVTVVGLGVAVGTAIGLAVSQVIRHVDDPMIEITLTTIAAYGSFASAEHVGASGVIATVVAGMLSGNYATRIGMTPSTRVAVEKFWEYVAFALNSLVFLLIGFEVRLEALLTSWPAIIAAYLAVMMGRAAVVSSVTALLRHTRERVPARWSIVLAWGGLRGSLSMVLALGLPRDMPHREFVVTVTFGVVVLSILLQGLTMATLLRRLGILRGKGMLAGHERGLATLQAARAALVEVDHVARTRHTSKEALEAARRYYSNRIEEAESRIGKLRVDRDDLQEEERLWMGRHLLMVEKETVMDGYRRGTIGQETYEYLLADVDGRLLALESGRDPMTSGGEKNVTRSDRSAPPMSSSDRGAHRQKAEP